VYALVKEYEEILEDEGLDMMTCSCLVYNSMSLLLELSDEIKPASATKGYPPNKLQRMRKAFKRLCLLGSGLVIQRLTRS
jgi:hypothetical protein